MKKSLLLIALSALFAGSVFAQTAAPAAPATPAAMAKASAPVAAPAKAAAAGNAVRLISQDAFCDGVQCFAVMGGDAMYFDDNHPSVAGAHRLARLLVPEAPATAPLVSAAPIANETQK